jgi:gluconolactonase
MQAAILGHSFCRNYNMSVDVKDPRIAEIVDPGASVETVAAGFQFTEGPVWHPARQDLRFSDIPANRIYRWHAAEGVTVYREPSQMANGNTYDRAGRMLSCDHATIRVVREESGGALQVLASHYDGKELNSPNDIIVSRDGGVWFTDPTYGRRGHTGVERPQVLGFQGVYRVDADGTLQLLALDFEQPNGLCLSLDEGFLYVADTTRRHIRRFALNEDGTLGTCDVFADSPAPDGLKVDSQGNLYAGGPGGVHVYDRDDGTCLGVIRTPAFCANFTWGGDDMRDLFMTASTALYRVRVQVPGVPLC